MDSIAGLYAEILQRGGGANLGYLKKEAQLEKRNVKKYSLVILRGGGGESPP